MASILDILVGILKAIPFFDKWFTKTPLEKEKEEKKKVDQEHEENKKRGRPSDDFWKSH